MKLLKQLARWCLSAMPLILFPRANVALNRFLGYDLADSVRIYSSAVILGNIQVSIGAETFIGHETLITGGMASIKIGARCDVSDRVGIFCGTHQIDAEGRRSAGVGYGRAISIEDGVWIGFGALVLPGVTIGEKAIVAAGTVVHKNVPPRCIVAGNPMRIIRTIDQETQPRERS
jgi:maltose O-acetyltransferase